MRILFVGLAGAAGVLLRYGIALAIGRQAFPWPTLAINVVGSLALGVLAGATFGRDQTPPLVPVLGTGLLGGFTTFSTFSVEAAQLLRDGRTGAAAAYVLVSVVGGLVAAALGFAAGRP